MYMDMCIDIFTVLARFLIIHLQFIDSHIHFFLSNFKGNTNGKENIVTHHEEVGAGEIAHLVK